MTPLHKMPKELRDYENEHGYEKTKAMVIMYDVPLYMYDYNTKSKKYCYDCGVEIHERVRCKECGKRVYIAAYGEDEWNKWNK